MPAKVDGRTPAQRRLLGEILDRLGHTRIELIRLEDWVDDFEEHASLGLVPTPEEIEESRGTCVRLVEPEPADLRVRWETRLAAGALDDRSEQEGLQPVVWLQFGERSGGSLGGLRRPPPLDERSLDQLSADIALAAVEAQAKLEYLDVLRPGAHAWAACLRVDEPHGFLRRHFSGFRDAVEPWSKACGGSYLEIRDDKDRPVLITSDGAATVRQDLACCDPLGIHGSMLTAPPPPPCPVFG